MSCILVFTVVDSILVAAVAVGFQTLAEHIMLAVVDGVDRTFGFIYVYKRKKEENRKKKKKKS
jgi:hypothetical protein